MSNQAALSNLRRRVNRARSKAWTTPETRHLHIMAECLATGKGYAMLQEEPEYCAETMLIVLEALWKLRRRER